MSRIQVLDLDVDTPWIRDYGPLQLEHDSGEITWLDTRYARDRPVDDQMPEWLSAAETKVRIPMAVRPIP